MSNNYDKYNVNQIPLTLTVPEAGKLLRVGRNTSYQLVRCGKLRSIKIGRQVRVPRSAVFEYLGMAQ